MALTRSIAPYNSDILGRLFEVDEPAVYVAQAARGWAINTFPAGKTPRLPKRITPRHVQGFDAVSGSRRKAIIADVTADLWTGVATTFVSKGGDGVDITCTVTGYVGEKASTRVNP